MTLSIRVLSKALVAVLICNSYAFAADPGIATDLRAAAKEYERYATVGSAVQELVEQASPEEAGFLREKTRGYEAYLLPKLSVHGDRMDFNTGTDRTSFKVLDLEEGKVEVNRQVITVKPGSLKKSWDAIENALPSRTATFDFGISSANAFGAVVVLAVVVGGMVAVGLAHRAMAHRLDKEALSVCKDAQKNRLFAKGPSTPADFVQMKALFQSVKARRSIDSPCAAPEKDKRPQCKEHAEFMRCLGRLQATYYNKFGGVESGAPSPSAPGASSAD